MVLVYAPGDPHDGSAGILIPMGCAKPGKGRNHITAVGVRHLGRHVFRILRGIDQAHFIPKPLDRRPSHENRTLQGIGHLIADSPGNGGHQPVAGEHRRRPRIHQKEAARPIGVLGFAGGKTCLSEQSCLLIPCRTADGNLPAEVFRRGPSVNAAGRSHLRQHSPRNVQFTEDLIVPGQGFDIEEHGPGSVGVIRHMHPALGELPDQPGLHGPEKEPAFPCLLPRPVYMLQDPADLRGGKIGVNDQPRLLADRLCEALLLQGITVG